MAGEKTPEGDKKSEAEASKETKDGKKGGKKKKQAEEELSDEDKALIEKMQMLVTRCTDVEKGLRVNALTEMAREIREATSSMTSVPKPLKFLRPHYATLQQNHTSEADEEARARTRPRPPPERGDPGRYARWRASKGGSGTIRSPACTVWPPAGHSLGLRSHGLLLGLLR